MLKNLIKSFFTSFLWAVLIVSLINCFFIHVKVPTGSMLPTIQLNDHLIIKRIYNTSTLNRGDIVVFESNYEEGATLYIKRLIGLPEDTIEFKIIDNQQTIWINGECLEEPYITFPSATLINETYIVPKDSYFFLGDNRNNSFDSRYWVNSYIHESQIKGKLIFNLSEFIHQ